MSAFNEFCFAVQAFADTFTPSLPVAYPAVNFTPPSEGAWLDVKWFPNQPNNYGIGGELCQMEQGVAQITVIMPIGGGYVAADELARSVVDFFPKGTSLGGVTIYRQPWAMAALTDSTWLRVPVSILWQGATA